MTRDLPSAESPSPSGIPRQALVIRAFHKHQPMGRIGLWTDGLRIGHGVYVIARWENDGKIHFVAQEDHWPRGVWAAYKDVWEWTEETLRMDSQ